MVNRQPTYVDRYHRSGLRIQAARPPACATGQAMFPTVTPRRSLALTRFNKHLLRSKLNRRANHEDSQRYPAKFKAEAVKQATERGHRVLNVVKSLGMSDKRLCLRIRLAKQQSGVGTEEKITLKAEASRIKEEPKKANEERDV